MKTFLSILSVKTNSFSSEKIVIGLLAVSADKVHFGYSKNKVNLLNKFSSDEKISLFVESLLSQIKSSVKGENKELSNLQMNLITDKSIFSEEYFNYLNNYNNGLLHFSKPLEVNYEFSENDFSKYFKNFIGEPFIELKKDSKKTFHQKLKPLLNKEGLSNKVDLHYTFNPNIFKGILKDCSIPLITKNGNINSLQEIDFTNKPVTIANNLYETKIIHDALKGFSTKIDCGVSKIKVAFEEPKLDTEQHKMFDLAIKEYSDQFEFITPDAVDSFTDNILEKNYSKFSLLVTG
ncbi:hypothetical protein DSM03_1011082 [Leeuwenhoekiella aestuarii]|uniref:DUF3037 domain-containing protein n=1 Tax=Leeuwenhoekiella aestuarii TaxID=2249426 RepID=A0A4Q0NZJ7_9FLAO|nr:hypothetical protein [Leeuwenhoekiella aestuarii]RXG18400.1 hypothetical protein DSM04_101593 [Leeuwenhoekiella aestuarii]RXG19705.1 hypothetical protein DSM03_1011082 [Leeuwenhoekiella aestuarii]